MDVSGRTALVTGAASGIGRACVEAFAAAGAQVLAVDLRAPDGFGAGVETLGLDVTGDDAPTRMVEAAVHRFGRLDIVHANAGIARSIPAADTTDDDWDRVLDVNLRSAFRLARAAAPMLRASPAGRLLFTASVMAEGTDFGLAAYCASKAGLLGLCRTLALELGRDGVTANCLLPGAIRTGMTAGLWDARPDVAEVWSRKAALRRLGAPEDVARVAVFLASDAAAFVTGQAIAVDGGLTLRV